MRKTGKIKRNCAVMLLAALLCVSMLTLLCIPVMRADAAKFPQSRLGVWYQTDGSAAYAIEITDIGKKKIHYTLYRKDNMNDYEYKWMPMRIKSKKKVKEPGRDVVFTWADAVTFTVTGSEAGDLAGTYIR